MITGHTVFYCENATPLTFPTVSSTSQNN